MTTIRFIDPTSLKENDCFILNFFLTYSTNIWLDPKKLYDMPSCNELTVQKEISLIDKINLSYPIVCVPSKNDINVFRFYVTKKKPLGGGSYGKVYEIIGRLILIDNKLVFTSCKPKVAKILQRGTTTTDLFNAMVINEFNLLSRLYAVKIPSILDDNAAIIMPLFQGKDFEKIYEEDMITLSVSKNIIPTDVRLEICINFLLALQGVHDKDIVHRDIKQVNAIVNQKDELLSVKIFDMGLSRDQDVPPSDRVIGTPICMAPEAFAAAACKESDDWSAALVLYFLFRGELKDPDTMEEAKQRAKTLSLKLTFNGINDLLPEHQDKINSAINCLLDPDPTKRSSKKTVIKMLEEVLLERIQKSIANENITQEQIKAVFDAGVKLRDKMHSLSDNIFQENNYFNLYYYIDKALQSIPESSEIGVAIATAILVRQSRIEMLQECFSQQEVVERVDALLKTFERQYTEFNSLLVVIKAELEKLNFLSQNNQLQNLTNNFKQLEMKIINKQKLIYRMVSLDSIYELSLRYKDYLKEYQLMLADYKKQSDELNKQLDQPNTVISLIRLADKVIKWGMTCFAEDKKEPVNYPHPTNNKYSPH